MEELNEIKARLELLESSVEACISMVNMLIRDFYQPGRVKQLKKPSEYGKRD